MKTIDLGMQELSVDDLVELAIRECGLVVAKSGRPVAEVIPLPRQSKIRIAPLHPGAWDVSDDFDHPLPDSFWLGEK